MLFHPRTITLARFADGALSERATRRVAKHLASCTRCRAHVASIRTLGDSARGIAVPETGDAQWRRIAARRVAGERVLLSTELTAAPQRDHRIPFSVGAVAAGIVLIVAVLGVEGVLVASQRGALSFSPGHPLPGANVIVRYRPITDLASAPALELRARFIPARQLLWYSLYGDLEGTQVATLERDKNGSFSGSFRMPDSAQYGLFSVATPGGDSVDTNSRSLWDVVASQPDGRVSFAGLRAQAFRPRGSPAGGGRAVDGANRLVALYPDSAQSWALQVEREGSSHIPFWLRVFGQREKRYAALDSVLSARSAVSAPEMAAMISFASAIEEPEAAAHWRARLLAEHPDDLLGIRERPDSEWKDHRELAVNALAALERAWIPQHDEEIAQYGAKIALLTGDSISLAMWAQRSAEISGYYFLFEPWKTSVGKAAADGLRRRYLVLISDSSTSRSLLATRTEDLGRRRAQAAQTILGLGRQLAALGQFAAARDTLALASQLGRGTCGGAFIDSLRRQTLRALGDSAEAARLASAPRPTGKCGRDWMLH